MNRKQKDEFVSELIDNIKYEIRATLYTVPENWDGIELRWFIADKYKECVFGTSGNRRGKRYLDYKNTCVIKNI